MNEKKFEYIDEEEKELIESIENGEWTPVVGEKRRDIERALEIAKRTLKKDKRMNIRISERDLRNLKIKALEKGLPYQTLVSMILHKYLTGKLKESA